MISSNVTKVDGNPDSFDVMGALRNVADAVRQYRWTVLITCALTLGLVTLYVYVWPPIYRAEALIMIERDKDLARDEFYVNWNVFRKEDARTEIELMASGPILKEVIEKENLTYDDVYHPIVSQLRHFWETSWPGVKYKALKNKLFPPDKAFLLTRREIELGKTIHDLAAAISIRPAGESNVGKLTMKGPSQRVAQVANTLMDVYMVRRTERHQVEARRALHTLTAELARAETDLKEIEGRRVAFFEEHGLEFNLQRELMQVEQLTNLETDIAKSRKKIAETEAALGKVGSLLANEPATKTISSVQELNAVREATKLRRLEFEIALIKARDRYLENSPEVREIKGDLAKLDAMLAEQSERVVTRRTEGLNTVQERLVTDRDSLRSALAAARAGLEVMEQTAAQIQVRLDEVPALQRALHALDREHGLLQEKYQVLALKRAQAEVSLMTTTNAMPSLRVVAYAVPPASRSWPSLKILYPAALMMGLFLGVVAAMIRRHASGRIHKADVVRERGDIPVYGTIAVPTRGRPLFVKAPPRNTTVPDPGGKGN